jgi:hypothetical protein
MSHVKESFANFTNTASQYFININSDTSYNYYKLNTTKYKYKLSTLPSGLILESSNNVTTLNRNLNNFRQRNLLMSYYTTETDISLLNIRASSTIMLDISTISVIDTSNINTTDIILVENSGNFYDLSNVKLSNFFLTINREVIIKSGEIYAPTIPRTESSANTVPTNNPSFYNDFNLYLLRQGAFGSSYIPPIYNNFETAMNLPSNPLVNPINSMNPLDYANTLFGPNITPTMISSMCLNQNVGRVCDNSTILRESNNNLVPTVRNNNATNATNATNTNATNRTSNTNTNTNTNTNINTTNATNATNATRNQNFMRERTPPYNPPLIFSDSTHETTDPEFIPRPVLTDFSSFGM